MDTMQLTKVPGDEDRDAHPQAGGGGVRGVRRPGHHDEVLVHEEQWPTLEVGREVRWAWEMYSIDIPVTVIAVEPASAAGRRVAGAGRSDDRGMDLRGAARWTTFVRITNSGFAGDGDALVQQVTDSTQGFSLVLAGLKALLEHGVRLNLVADRYPAGIEAH